jgi:hypothetical protein
LRTSAARGRPAVNKRLIWTRYYRPREFHGHFRSDFIDRRLAGWPLLRSIGDHFLIMMRKR